MTARDSRPHVHKCALCRQPYDCTGEYVRNHDGWPDPVCAAQMEPNINFQCCPICRVQGERDTVNLERR